MNPCIRTILCRRTIHSVPKEVDLKAARKKFMVYGGGRVVLEKDGTTGLATIRLSNVNKKNAISGKMMNDLAECVDELERWEEGKGVILTGEGDFFCSGGDLETVKNIMNSDDGYIMSSLMHDTTGRLLDLPLLSVALVNGPALGGGAELTLGCDYRVFSARGSLSFVQARMGVVPGWGGGTRLVKLLGATKSLDILTLCPKIDAEAALQLGLSSLIAEQETRFEDTRQFLLERINKHPSKLVRSIKEIVREASVRPLREALAEERKIFSSLWGGTSHQEAMTKKPKHR